MKKIFSLLVAIGSFSAMQAQYQPDGTQITGDFNLKDINGVTKSLNSITSAGKHLVIDLSATWCGPCWSFHQSKALDNYYDKYGPTGNVSKDAEVYLVEVDLSTTTSDLNGTGSSTAGNWVAGTTHPIVDVQTAAEESSIVGKFVTGSYGIPAVFVVCADKKLYKFLNTSGSSTDAQIRSFATAKCGLAPVGINEVNTLNFSYDLYPNPASNNTTLSISVNNNEMVGYTVTNQMGQIVGYKAPQNLQSGVNTFDINTQNLANGLYFIQLSVGNEKTSVKLQVNH
jgi:hypothetical protein